MARSLDYADYQDTPRPIAAMGRNYPDGDVIPWHTHPRDQLIYATSGVMRVVAASGSWVLPPNRALWVPAGIEHQVRMAGDVTMRTLYLTPGSIALEPGRCKAVQVSGLLRALILEAVELPLDYEEEGRAGHVMALIMDELQALDAQPLRLPLPQDKRLRVICDALLENPGLPHTLDVWSELAGASSRTLARLFQQELGMRFVDWRQQARLAEALAWLVQGRAIAVIAQDLGYDSASAFTTMFRRVLGKSPRDYFQARP